MTKNAYLKTALLASASIPLSLSAHAQETNPKEDLFVLETIEVTAQRRSQSANDVPVAITAFTGEKLKKLGAKDPTALGDFTPGLAAVNNAVGAPAYTLRGVGLEDFIGNNTSGTAIYFDEVYPVSATQQGFQMYDLQRVEVLKGPQGTLYGRNASGGAINFVPNRPTEDAEFSISAGIDSLAEINLVGIASGALADNARGRLSVNYIKGLDEWQDGGTRGADTGKADKLSARGQLEFDVSDSTTALISVFGERDHGINETWQADDQAGYEALTGIRVQSTDDVREASLGEFFTNFDGTDAPVNDTSSYGVTLKINSSFDAGDLASITNYQVMDRFAYDNNDGSPEELADFRFSTDVEQFSQEFRFSTEFEDLVNVITGAFYGWDSIDVDDVAAITGFLDVFGLPSPTPSGEATISVDSTQKTTSLGMYVHTEWDLSQEWKATLAGRYTYEKREFDGAVIDDQGYFFGAPGPIFPIFGLPDYLQLSETENDFSYRIGLDYTPNKNLLLYASLATGFKSGVFYSGAVFDPRGWGYIEPEQITAYETGAKWTTLEGAMQVNLAGFYYDYKDKQTLVVIDDPFGAITTLGNVPKSRSYGGELEVQALLTANLNVTAGLALLETEIREAPTTNRGATLLATIQEGSELTQSPSISFNTQIDYRYDLSETLTGNAELTYSYSADRKLFLGDPLSRADNYHSVGARLSVADDDAGWEVAVYGRNLTGEDAVTFAFVNIIGNRTYALQRPRVIGLEATFNF